MFLWCPNNDPMDVFCLKILFLGPELTSRLEAMVYRSEEGAIVFNSLFYLEAHSGSNDRDNPSTAP